MRTFEAVKPPGQDFLQDQPIVLTSAGAFESRLPYPCPVCRVCIEMPRVLRAYDFYVGCSDVLLAYA